MKKIFLRGRENTKSGEGRILREVQKTRLRGPAYIGLTNKPIHTQLIYQHIFNSNIFSVANCVR